MKNNRNYCTYYNDYFRNIGNAFEFNKNDRHVCQDAGSFCDKCSYGCYRTPPKKNRSWLFIIIYGIIQILSLMAAYFIGGL